MERKTFLPIYLIERQMFPYNLARRTRIDRVMRTWWTDRQQSQEDRLSLSIKLRDSVLEMSQHFCSDYQAKIQQSLGGEKENYLDILHPDFFEWYFALVQSITNGTTSDLYSGSDILLDDVFQNISASRQRAIANEKLIGATIDVTSNTGKSSNVLVRALHTAEEIHGCHLKIELLQNLSKKQIQAIQNSFILLREIWPEAHEELEDFVQRIQFFDGEQVIGFVDFQNHGSIFLRQEDMNDEVWLAEQILHEGSHIRLNTVLAVTPLFLNDSKVRYESPLRREPRHMFGLFHQMFVLSRLSHLYMRLSRVTDQYQEKLQVINNQLNQAIKVVRRHADLTREGSEIVDTICQVVG